MERVQSAPGIKAKKRKEVAEAGRRAPRSCSLARGRRKGETNGMDFKMLSTVFTAVFIAELGDKTQLATLLFAADKQVDKYTVFIGAAAALIVASAIGVIAGGAISKIMSEKALHIMAGIGFIGIGIWTLLKA
jgi:putative Ca2+/H+ antiporter (TMEM165/GDT1 family)